MTIELVGWPHSGLSSKALRIPIMCGQGVPTVRRHPAADYLTEIDRANCSEALETSMRLEMRNNKAR